MATVEDVTFACERFKPGGYECPICFGAYSNQKLPRFLPCEGHHTVCEDCLRRLITLNNTRCPCCNRTINFNGKSFTQFPLNNFIIDSVQAQISNSPKTVALCSMCKEQGSERMFMFCKTCYLGSDLKEEHLLSSIEQKAICCSCLGGHARFHTLLPLVDLRVERDSLRIKNTLESNACKRNDIRNTVMEILHNLEKSEELSKDLAYMSANAKSSKTTEDIEKIVLSNRDEMRKALTLLQDKFMKTMQRELEIKVSQQEKHIKNFQALCPDKVKNLTVQSALKDGYQLVLVYAGHLALLFLAILHLTAIQMRRRQDFS